MKNLGLSRYFEISRLLGLRTRHEAVILLLMVSATFFESIGLAMFLPIAEFIQSGGDVEGLRQSSKIWGWLVRIYGALYLPVTLPVLILSSFFFILIRQVFSYYRQLYFQKVFHGMIQHSRLHLFDAYLYADTAYHDREQSGGVVNSMTSELTLAIQAIVAPVLMLSYSIIILFYLLVLSLITGPVAVAAIGTMAISGYILKRYLDKTASSGDQVAEANQSMSAFLVQRLGSIRLIRLSGTEDAEKSEMRRLTIAQRDHMISIYDFLARVNVLMEPITLAISLLVLYAGVTFLELRLEQIAVFVVLALIRLLPAIKELMATAQAALGYQASLETLVRRLQTAGAARETRDGTIPFEFVRDQIQLTKASFSYPMAKSTRAIKSIDLTIPANQMTAIVGPSGAGKSTLVDLLPRLREVTSGEILIDGTEINSFDTTTLRNGIAYVSQTPLVFNVTAAEHIAYGKTDANPEEIREAAKLAGAHKFISNLPNGYDTMIGERGVRLSGGQLQRLDLARALVRQSSILILDEPTSNLDAEAEARFRKTLRRIRSTTNATIIVIAHRLSTIMDADQIVVMMEGEIDATGNHSSVLANSRWYRDAFEEQSISSAEIVTPGNGTVTEPA
ncbi:MAG TPA: hypothetical protein DCS82_11540 [Rhodospirillaceae bacterium]|nr:hypothetical protein [Rhodospirillaceae bacterium]HAT36343.1 hypothetical protein [Rhodospirillaceae bacterium]